MDKVEKIRRLLRRKERLWFSKSAKFKSYLLKNNEDSCEILQTFV